MLDRPKFPVVVDPETGEKELVGNGRVAFIRPGQHAVSTLVQLEQGESINPKPDTLDTIITSGDLPDNA